VLEIISWVDFLGMHRDGRLKQLQDIPDSYPSAKIQKQMTAHEVGVLTEEIVDVVDALAKTVRSFFGVHKTQHRFAFKLTLTWFLCGPRSRPAAWSQAE
jgi:hypothetical protein